jgi:hypothetical protein
MTYREVTFVLVVAMAICSTAAAGTGETTPQKTTINNASHRLQVLRIVESKSAAHSPAKATSGRKKIARRSVVKHGPSFAHKLSPARTPEAARSNDNPMFSAEQTGKLTVSRPLEVSSASEKVDLPLTTTDAQEETNKIDTALHGTLVQTQKISFVEAAGDDSSLYKPKSTFPLLATLSGGAILASGVGFFLVGPRRRSRIRLTPPSGALSHYD